jgi:hypothetical protein
MHLKTGTDPSYTQLVSIAARPTSYTSLRRRPRLPLHTCTKRNLTAASSTCQSYCRDEKSRHLPHWLAAVPAVPLRTSGPVFLDPRRAEVLQAAVELAQTATVIVRITIGPSPYHALGHPYHPPAAAANTDLDRPLRRDPVPEHPRVAAIEVTGAAATSVGAVTITATETDGEAPVAIATPAEAVAAVRCGDKTVNYTLESGHRNHWEGFGVLGGRAQGKKGPAASRVFLIFGVVG